MTKNPELEKFSINDLIEEIKSRKLEVPMQGSITISKDSAKFFIDNCTWPEGNYNILITFLGENHE